MHRRNIIRLLAGAVLAWPLAASAEQRVHAIGVLASQPLPAFENFVGKLRDYGYIEGENCVCTGGSRKVMSAIPNWLPS